MCVNRCQEIEGNEGTFHHNPKNCNIRSKSQNLRITYPRALPWIHQRGPSKYGSIQDSTCIRGKRMTSLKASSQYRLMRLSCYQSRMGNMKVIPVKDQSHLRRYRLENFPKFSTLEIQSIQRIASHSRIVRIIPWELCCWGLHEKWIWLNVLFVFTLNPEGWKLEEACLSNSIVTSR